MPVKIRMKVISKKEQKGWQKIGDTTPNLTTIEMEVANTSDPNDPNYPYSFWSGGTKFPLMTINEEAARHFEIDKDYDILITPAE